MIKLRAGGGGGGGGQGSNTAAVGGSTILCFMYIYELASLFQLDNLLDYQSINHKLVLNLIM